MTIFELKNDVTVDEDLPQINLESESADTLDSSVVEKPKRKRKYKEKPAEEVKKETQKDKEENKNTEK